MEKVAALIAKYPRWIALVAGGVSATGFAPLNLWPLTLLCLALLMRLVASADSGKRAFLIGWLFGVGHFSVGNNWIATAFTYQAAMPAWLGWIAVVLLALYLAVYPALACWGAWWVAKRVEPKIQTLPVSWAFVLAFAGFWIIAEWLRSWVFTGFAWNPLGVITLPMYRYGFSTMIGSYGLAAIPVVFAGTICLLMTKRWAQGLSIAIILALWGGIVTPQTYVKQGMGLPELPNLTIVQPNISQIDKHTEGYEAVNFIRLAQNSRPKDNSPRLLLWPESATPWWLEDGYPRQAYFNQPGGTALRTRQTLVRLLGPNDLLLTGGDRLVIGPDGKLSGARNSVLAMDAKAEILAAYDKAHLVPYGEYLALRWLLEPLGATRLVPGAIDFLPGPGPHTLELPFEGRGVKAGVQICYEIIFSGQVVDRKNRPDFIFNPSNDAWFGSWGPPQHLAQARLRAVEEGLPVIRSTPTGISAIISPYGRIINSLPLGTIGRIDAKLPRAKAPTLFARYGNILPLSFAALLIALAFLPLVRRRISR